MNGPETVQAAFGSELIATGSNSFELVYLPEGKHEISATVAGKPKTISVTVDDRVLASFQADLSKRLADNVRPFAGFDHKTGPASMLPTAFRYEQGVGLILQGELTKAGSEAIDGRNYSYWSPTFLQSKGIPVGLDKSGEIGSFVNDPAFRTIERIAASHTETIMDITPLIELGLVEAGQEPETALEVAKAAVATLRESASTAEAVTAAHSSASQEIERFKGEIETVKASLTTAQTELQSYRDKEAEAVKAANAELIQAAVNRGAIPPQDDATKGFWAKSLESDAEGAKAALAALPGKEAAKGESVMAGMNKAGDGKPEPITRAELDAMSPIDRNAYMRSGGKVIKD